jgi:beta-galactosidase
MKYRGVDYYPDVWPEEGWSEDIQLMSDANINLVKLGVFSWSRLEPNEGKFEFDWLEKVSSILTNKNISIMLATPTGSPPAWLTCKYPEVLNSDHSGNRRIPHGSRRHYCPSSDLYLEKSLIITEKLALFAKDNKNIVAWQIDNEIAVAGECPPCQCSRCTTTFRSWLESRYNTIENLNKAWNTLFWGAEFTSFKQIEPPYPQTSWQLDYLKFQNELFSDFIAAQVTVIKKHNSQANITTNSWAGFGSATDINRIASFLDFVSYDCYMNYHGNVQTYQASLDLYRNLKPEGKPFWIAETGAWNCVTTEDNSLDALKAWQYEFIARGVEAVIYFRWRQSIMGEEEHPAIVGWSGKPTVQYQKIKESFNELSEIEKKLGNMPLPESEAAILWHPDLALLQHIDSNNYSDNVILADNILNSIGILPQIIPVTENINLNKYKLIILPQFELVEDYLADKLTDFIKNGGALLAQPQLAVRDINGKYLAKSTPDLCHELFGITIDNRFSIKGTPRYGPVQFIKDEERSNDIETVDIQGDLFKNKAIGHQFMEAPFPAEKTRIIAEYKSGIFKGLPALTENSFYKGTALYQACWLDEASTSLLFKYAADIAEVKPDQNHSSTLTSTKRGKYHFYINHSKTECIIKLPEESKVIYSEKLDRSLNLEQYGICITESNKE